ncbi:putative DNA-binding protein [Serratia rubidaea]|uniref:helix-turn-helix transcriptional regulator n=1 Tax=Serratia rubidaea TaxID=61652 RepID=UPI00077351D9|nr:helix-turn-helix transcriptional regulator [Serratia rubidaea]AML55883.1 putative DNA-binding protein [Serratia rubidaea]
MSETISPFDAGQADNRKQLGAFLRARRESLDPNRLGLPRMRQRRTPGLRREEVAQLADVGITWYTWLEQGRAIQASAKTLSAIAHALQCNEAETHHLFRLAGQSLPASARHDGCEKLSPYGQRLLDQLDPLPAIISNARFDILGFNRAYCLLMGVDLATLPPEDRNCIYLAFTHEQWRASQLDWDDIMPKMVALFRAQMAEHLGDPVWEQQLARYLSVSADFRALWERHEVRSIDNNVKRFLHPQVGEMSLRQNNWWSAPRNGDRMLVYIPADEQSERRLQLLTGGAE